MSGTPRVTTGAPRLPQSLGPGGVLTLTLAALSPAASVYVTGAVVLHIAGTGVVIAVVAGGVVTLVATALYAELGAAFPHAGGVYYGIGQVLGTRAGTVAMLLGVLVAPALIAFVALGLASYVRAALPGAPMLPVAIGAIAIGVVASVLRVRRGLWLTGTLLAAELAGLALLCLVGLHHHARGLAAVVTHPQLLGPGGGLVAPSAAQLVIATIGAAYASSGSNLALNFAEELTDAQAVIGRVVLTGGVLAVLLVAAPLIAIALGVPDLGRTFAAEAPITAALQSLAGPAVAKGITAAVALAILDHVAGALIAYSRLVFAVARSTSIRVPVAAALARLSTRAVAPAAAATALGAVAMLLTLVGQRGLLLIVSGELITPLLMITAVLVGRRRGLTGRTGFRSPFYPVLPLVALAIIAVFVVADMVDPIARWSIGLLVTFAAIAAIFVVRFVTPQIGKGQ